MWSGATGSHWIEPAGGNAVWLTLPTGADARAAQSTARRKRIVVTPGDLFFFDGTGSEHMSLCFGRVPAEDMDEAIGELADIIRRSSRTLRTGRRSA